MIPYGKQDINQDDLDSVLEVLKSDFLTQGPQVPIFEKSVSEFVGAKYGVAVNSATSALHIACLSLGFTKGDILWTSPNTFVASANCAIYCGGKVDFVDIDPDTLNMCPQALEAKLILAKDRGLLPKIVVPVHFAGQSCDMKKIHELSLQYDFKIIEDASHAIGGKYLNQYVGNCSFSDITVFSFHPVKIITTAEGGLATTNQLNLAERMNLFRTHGITRDKDTFNIKSEGPWYYEQHELGFNYRLTELQAALGISQLKRVLHFIEKRHILRESYEKSINSKNIILPKQDKNCYSALHLYPIQLRLEELTLSKKEIFESLRDQGIGVNLHYIPVHFHPYYEKLGFKRGDFPNAENYYKRAISIPLFPSMSSRDQEYVISTILKTIK
jgi:UDP-4-amino-4,6-dideoxy-N-acetyl-beta-L-altrosamine transaminase